MHPQVKQALGVGWTPQEWQLVSLGHPVLRLHLQGQSAAAHKLLREYTAAHEAGHAVVGKIVGAEVHRIEIAMLHEIEREGTLGFAEYSWPRQGGQKGGGLEAEALMDLAGIAGHEVVYNNGWGLDAAAWTEPGQTAGLRGEEEVGGDLYEARRRVRAQILAGGKVLGRSNTADALVSLYEQAEALLIGRRGTLLRLAGHLLAYGRADRETVEAIWGVGE